MARRLAFVNTIRPLSSNETMPHGRSSTSPPASNVLPEAVRSAAIPAREVLPHERDRLIRRAHVWTMPRGLHLPQRAAVQCAMHVLADLAGRDDVVRALQDQRRDAHV